MGPAMIARDYLRDPSRTKHIFLFFFRPLEITPSSSELSREISIVEALTACAAHVRVDRHVFVPTHAPALYRHVHARASLALLCLPRLSAPPASPVLPVSWVVRNDFRGVIGTICERIPG